jgi:invasion protein IalB
VFDILISFLDLNSTASIADWSKIDVSNEVNETCSLMQVAPNKKKGKEDSSFLIQQVSQANPT